jgi:signal recognition particle subunit SRP54
MMKMLGGGGGGMPGMPDMSALQNMMPAGMDMQKMMQMMGGGGAPQGGRGRR